MVVNNRQMFRPRVFHKRAARKAHRRMMADCEIQQQKPEATYTFVQRNGQRTYGPPEWWRGPPPPKGCEVFVGKLPKNLTDAELQALVPVFERVGPVYEMRLLMQFSQQNRGYGFVKYGCPEDAERAVDVLNGFQVRPGKNIGVIKSAEHCKIEIEDLCIEGRKTAEIREELACWTKGVVRVQVERPTGKVEVEYESHLDAGVARRELLFQARPFGQALTEVYWAAQPSELPTLFVNNIPMSASENQLRKLFFNPGLSYIDKINGKSYAFVRYKTKEDAEKAMLKINGAVLNGFTLEAKWAKRSNSGKSVKFIRGRNQDRDEENGLVDLKKSLWMDDPIRLLKAICDESGFQEPFYTVTYNDSSSSSSFKTYTASVYVPNLPVPVNSFLTQSEGFSTPELAKAFAAMTVLKYIGYNHNFGFDFPSQQVFNPAFLNSSYNVPSLMPPQQSLLSSNICHDERPVNILGDRISYPSDFPSLLRDETPSMDMLAEAVALANMGLQSTTPHTSRFSN